MNQTDEEQAKHNESEVAEQMVEIPDCSKGFEIEVFVVAEIMAACLFVVIAQVQHCVYSGERLTVMRITRINP